MLVRCNLKGSVSEPNAQYGFADANRAGAAPRLWPDRMAGGLGSSEGRNAVTLSVG